MMSFCIFMLGREGRTVYVVERHWAGSPVSKNESRWEEG